MTGFENAALPCSGVVTRPAVAAAGSSVSVSAAAYSANTVMLAANARWTRTAVLHLVIVIPRAVLDLGRQPDRFVHFLHIGFLGDFIAHGEICILGFGRAREAASIEIRCRQDLTQRCLAFRAAFRSCIVDTVAGLVDRVARIACIFVGRHAFLLLLCFVRRKRPALAGRPFYAVCTTTQSGWRRSPAWPASLPACRCSRYAPHFRRTLCGGFPA